MLAETTAAAHAAAEKRNGEITERLNGEAAAAAARIAAAKTAAMAEVKTVATELAQAAAEKTDWGKRTRSRCQRRCQPGGRGGGLMEFGATFFVGLAFLVFVGVLFYYKVPGMLTKGLDERAEKIRNDLDEARRLREEAQTLLATYERKQRDAMQEAEAMIAHAEEEAKREAVIAAEKLEESIKRREQLALEKIALAEAQAEKDVREAAVEVAVTAAGRVIAEKVTGAKADALVDPID